MSVTAHTPAEPEAIEAIPGELAELKAFPLTQPTLTARAERTNGRLSTYLTLELALPDEVLRAWGPEHLADAADALTRSVAVNVRHASARQNPADTDGAPT